MEVLYFTAQWCGPCKLFGPILLEVSQTQNIEIKKIDIDEQVEMAKFYQIKSVPTVVFLNNNKEIGRHVGLVSKTRLVEAIKKIGF